MGIHSKLIEFLTVHTFFAFGQQKYFEPMGCYVTLKMHLCSERANELEFP